MAEAQAAIEAFLANARAATGLPLEAAESFAFGDSPEMADTLAALVVSGPKRGTAGLLADYEARGESAPTPGDVWVVLDGSGRPAAVIRTTAVEIVPFREVDAAFAFDEGEGDRSLAYWRDAHRDYFGRTSPGFTESDPVVCERFELLHPVAT